MRHAQLRSAQSRLPPSFLVGGLAHEVLETLQLEGGQKLAVRDLRQALVDALDADVCFDLVVVRCEFAVAEGPVGAMSVDGTALEVVLGEAE